MLGVQIIYSNCSETYELEETSVKSAIQEAWSLWADKHRVRLDSHETMTIHVSNIVRSSEY